MLVITAQMEQISEKNQSASVTHNGSGCFVQLIVAKVAPVQKDACFRISAV
jgi:hypothetical protein